MTLLTTIQDAALEMGLPSPSSVVTATTNQLAQQLLAHCNATGQDLRSRVDWPQLTIEYTFTLATSTASYAMPGDFDRFAFSTFWDRSNSWEMMGPILEADWQAIKSGVSTTSIWRRWRFKGYTDKQFFFADTPTSGDNGQTMVFEYYTKNWIRPKTWVTSTSFGAGSYSFYNGNYYSTAAGGTTGATPPTHTSGSASDGTVTWTYVSAAYEKATADTDVFNIDPLLIKKGIIWQYREAHKLMGWDTAKADYDEKVNRLADSNRGAAPINLNTRFWMRNLGYPVTPETGFGS